MHLQSSKRSFRKIQIFKFAYSALPLFYSLFRLSHRGIGLFVTLDMFTSVHDYSFRFVSQNTVSLMKTFEHLLCLSENNYLQIGVLLACVAGVGRGRKEERRAREGREDRKFLLPPALILTFLPFYGLPRRLASC